VAIAVAVAIAVDVAVAVAAAATVAISVAVIFAVTIAITLASLDIALFVCHLCHPHHCSLCCRRRCRCSPTTLFAIAIALAAIALFAASHSRCRLLTLLAPAAISCCQPSPAAVVTLFSRPSIIFAASIDGWLLCSLCARQHTD